MLTRRIRAALAVGIAAIAGVVVVPATPASASTYTAYVSSLTPSGHIGPSVIDMKDWSTGDGGVAQLWILRTSGNVNNQRWHINRVVSLSAPFGKFQFTNAYSGKCLTANLLPRDNHTVRQNTCSNSDSQW